MLAFTNGIFQKKQKKTQKQTLIGLIYADFPTLVF